MCGLHIFTCMWAHVWVSVYKFAYMYIGQSLTSVSSLTILYHWYWGISLNPEIANSASLVSWFALGSPCPYIRVPRLGRLPCLPHISSECQVNSSPHTYIEGALSPTKPSPQLSLDYFNYYILEINYLKTPFCYLKKNATINTVLFL